MAWGTPMTAVANSVFLASQWNTSVRDNLNATLAGKATTAGRWFAATDISPIDIAQREITAASQTNPGTTSSGSYTTSLGGTPGTNPSVTVTCNSALVFFNCMMSSSSSTAVQLCSVAVSGGTTISASDNWAAQCDGVTANNANRLGSVVFFGQGSDMGTLNTSASGPSHTFTMQYRSNGSATVTVSNREIIVFAL